MNINSSSIIKIIQEELNSLGYNYVSQEIKAFSQNDYKKLKLFTISLGKKVDKAKENMIIKIVKIFQNKPIFHLDDIKQNLPINDNLKEQIKMQNNLINNSLKSKLNLDKSFNNFLNITDNKIISLNRNNVLSPKDTKVNILKRNYSPNFQYQICIKKSKSAKKIITNLSTNSKDNDSQLKQYINKELLVFSNLAKNVISFIDDMKNLQKSICKKESNVIQLKQKFEKKKNMLYNEAKQLIENQEKNLKNEQLYSNKEDNTENQNFINLNSQSTAKTRNSTPSNFSNVIYNSNNNSKQETKVLKDSIVALNEAIVDIKSNNKFITEQLRTEIKKLKEEVEKKSESLKEYEKSFANNLESIRSIYKLIKEYSPVLDSMPIQTSLSLVGKFKWYEEEIKKIISILPLNNLNNTTSHFETKRSTVNIGGDIDHLQDVIKKESLSIIEMLNPYIKERESEIDMSIFESKDNAEEGITISSINNLKKYIKYIVEKIEEMKKVNELLRKQLKESKQKIEIYKTSLENAIKKITYHTKKKNDRNDCIEVNTSEIDAVKKLYNELLNIQKNLLQKLEFKDIENEKNIETIKSLLEINNAEKGLTFDNGENSPDFVSKEKYLFLLNLYSCEEDKSRTLKNEYLHLVQELSDYAQNGNKIVVDLSVLAKSTKRTSIFNIEEELDSYELGRINQNDLLTDKETNIALNSRESICNINTDNKKIQSLKLELKKTSNELERVLKQLNDYNKVLSTIGNAFIKLINEIHITPQIKEYLFLIFRLLNYSENDINKFFLDIGKSKK